MDNMIINDPRVYAGATGRDLHIDTPLTNMTIGYRAVGLIADRVFPPLTSAKQSDGYYIWDRAEWLRIRNAQRARGTMANRINFQVSTATYFANNFALGIEIPVEDLSNADEALEVRVSGMNLVQDNLMLNWEDRIAVLMGNTANVGSNNTLTNDYSNVALTTPVDDIDAGIQAIRSVTGVKPNRMVIGGLSFQRFRRHQDIIDFIRGKGDNVGGGGVTEAQIAGAFGLEEVLVGNGVKNTAGEGEAATYSDIWSTTIALYHAPRAPGRMVPSYGYTFQWRPAGFPAPMAVDRYEIRERHVEAVEVHHWQDERVTATELGFLIIGA